MYYYEGMLVEEPVTLGVEQVSVIAKSHPTVTESHSDIELHIDVENQSDNVKL